MPSTYMNQDRREQGRKLAYAGRKLVVDGALVAGLVAAGVALRLTFRDVPNFAPVAALALFSGYLLRSWWIACLVPLATMGLSDLVVGAYDWRMMLLVYGMLTVPVFLGSPLRRYLPLANRKPKSATAATAGLVGCSLASSLTFFAATNLGCWLWWYERSASGLAACYTAALPFFRYTVLGDLAFAVTLFGSYALVCQLRSSRAAAGIVSS